MTDVLNDYLMNAIVVVLVVFSIMLHEIGHALAAYLLGDTTAKEAGRLTLNPLKHLDPFGSVLMPFLLVMSGGPVIGYAKPVPYNPNRLKDRKSGEIIVGLAGPAANLVLALLGALVAFVASNVYAQAPQVWYWVWQIAAQFVIVNLCLMFFNLIPVPPLDGSSIIAPFLPDSALPRYYQIQHYAMPVFIIVVLILPWMFHIDPVGFYIDHTAVRLAYLLLGM